MPQAESAPVESVVRTAINAACECGEKLTVLQDGSPTCRADGKRVIYTDDGDDGWCVFRCRRCGRPVHESCIEAA